MAYPKFLGGFRNDATANLFAIRLTAGPGAWNNITLTQQFWFMEVGVGATHFLTHVQTQVRALGGNFASFTVSVSTGGIVTLTNSVAVDIVWDGTVVVGIAATDIEVRRILGFAGNLAGTASYTAPNQHKYGWWPDAGVTDADGSLNVAGTKVADAVVVQSPSGNISGTSNATRVNRRLVFSPVSEQYAQPTSAVLNRSYEEFWDQVLRLNSRFRFYPDRSLSTFYTYQAAQDTARDGTSKIKRVVRNWYGLFEIEVEMHQYVA